MSTDIKDDLRQHVSAGDVLAAVRQVHGDLATLHHWEVRPATSSVQGFTSLMLRVTAHVTLPPGNTAHVTEQSGNTTDVAEKPGNTVTTSLIVKRLPVVQEMLEFSAEMEVFEREVAFFTQVMPILQKQCPSLPVVRCLVAHDSTILMEDLCASGYNTLGKSVKEVISDKLDLSFHRLTARRLAQMHAASLGTDWLKIMPEYFKLDCLFEGPSIDNFAKQLNLGIKAVAAVLTEFFPEKDAKYSKWLLSDEYFKTLTKMSKADPNCVNVLCHGDCWLNNMMFKVDPVTKKALDMKFIDLQVYRYAPASRDILYFLQFCTNKRFRDAHEDEILRTYVDAFNAAACQTPDLISYESFRQEYQQSRLFGIGFGIVFRPLLLLEDVMPRGGDELSVQQFESLMYGDHTQDILAQFTRDAEFRLELTDMVEELVLVLHNNGHV